MPDFSIAGDKSQDRKSAVTSDGRRSARHLADIRHCRRSLVFREHPSAARRTLGNSVLVVTTKASVGPGPGAAMTSVSSQTGPTTRLVLVERSTRSCRSTVPSFVPTGRVPSTRTGQRTSSGHPGIEGPSASTRPGRIDKKPAKLRSSLITHRVFRSRPEHPDDRTSRRPQA